MRGRACWAVGIAVLLRCATASAPHPTPEHKILGCQISCANNMQHSEPSFVFQHRCTEGSMKRHLQDVIITGETAAIDERTGKTVEQWVTLQGDYPKRDVELRTCSSYVDLLRSQMSAEQRGQFPGENPDGTTHQ